MTRAPNTCDGDHDPPDRQAVDGGGGDEGGGGVKMYISDPTVFWGAAHIFGFIWTGAHISGFTFFSFCQHDGAVVG